MQHSVIPLDSLGRFDRTPASNGQTQHTAHLRCVRVARRLKNIQKSKRVLNEDDIRTSTISE